MSLGPQSSVWRACVGYLLFVLSLVLTVFVQNCKGKPPVATGKKDEAWAPVVSVATGTLPYTEYDPLFLLPTLMVLWSGSDSPRVGLLGILWVIESVLVICY
jgi:hypothetical protein